MKTRKADVIVIGAGTAGLAAYRAVRDAGHRVLLVDHGPLGTTCARVGCMPSKAALHAGRRFATADSVVRLDASARKALRDRLWREVRAMRDDLADGTVATTRDDVGRDLVMGRARFVAADAIEVDGKRLEVGACVIATGSHPVVPDALARYGTSIASGILTTDTLFSLKRLPVSIGLLGLGAIGLELGLALARLGVRVVGVEKASRLAGIEDPVIAGRALATLGSTFPMHVGSEGQVTRDGSGYRVAIDGRTHRVDRVLAALGRKPNLGDLSLDAAGVEWDDADPAPIDPHTLRLGRAALFVAGDASPMRPFQHEAVDEGRIAAANALAHVRGEASKHPARRTPLSIVFCDPDIAQIGLSHDDVHRDGIIVGTAGGDGNGRSKILGDEGNLLRIYADRADGTLRGASLVSTHGEHLAHLLALAIDRELTAAQMLAMPFYHPTVEEMLQTALQAVVKRVAKTSNGPQRGTSIRFAR